MKNRNKRIVMMASIILTLAISVAGTLAWLYTEPQAVENTFTPAKVGNYIHEVIANNEKTEVKIYNDIDDNEQTEAPDEIVNAYIRAEVVVTWQDANGNVLPEKPDESAYEINYNLNTVGTAGGKWVKYTDGYYYYTAVIEPGAATDVLINSCKPTAAAPVDNYTLHVEILSQSIQAEGVKLVDGVEKKPVELVWGIDPTTL